MKNSITICIGTIGSPTFKKCKKIVDKLAANNSYVINVVVIKNKKPQSAWLNAMRDACKDTKWCLQVDEDMYLSKNAINTLLKFAIRKEREGVKILNASSLLYDLFLKKKIGSLKLWNSEALQKLEFRDVLGGDRDLAKRAKKFGYRNVEISEVLGNHDSAPTPEIAFKKYYEYVHKIRKFESDLGAKHFSEFLRKKWKKEKTRISKKAYDGSVHALKGPIINKSKGSTGAEDRVAKKPSIIYTKKPNFLIATPIWKRPEVFKIFVKNNKKYGDILAVGSEGRASRGLAKNLGCKYVEVPNSPLGKKFNARIKFFLKNKQYSHIILLGSDDIICPKVFDNLKKYIKYYDLISWKDIYFYDILSKEGVYCYGYNNHRKGEPLAPGRCISRALVEKLGPKLWTPSLTKSPDGNLWKNKLSKVRNQKILSCESIGGYIVDIKSDVNKNSLSKIKNATNKRPLTKRERAYIESMLGISG